MECRRLTTAVASLVVVAGCASSTDRSTPPTPAPSALPITSTRWDEGRITLGDGAPTEDWGVVAAPTTPGRHPVALLLHGNHPTCPTDTGGRTWPCPPGTEQPNQEGLAYLADALAERGFVAVAPGINVQYTFGAGEPMAAVRTAEIAARTLDRLAAGDLGIDPAALDLSRLVVVGHSVGGQDAGLLAAGRTSFDRPVGGVVMLQPALNDSAALPLVEVPAAIVLSECDGDTGVRGGTYLTQALLTTRRSPSALLVLLGANHNGTNSLLRPDAFPVGAPACDEGRALTADAQRERLAAIVPELAHAVLGDGSGAGWAGHVFDEPAPPDDVRLAVQRAGEPVAPLPGPGPGVPASLRLQGMQATFCPEGYYTPFAKPGTEACHRPELPMFVGTPQTVALSWDAAGASITAPVDVPAGGAVRLRVLADFADARLTGPLQLRLSAGGASTVVDVPVPEVRRESVPPFELAHGLAMWTTATLPVEQAATQATVEVVAPSAGSMQVVSLGER